MCRSPNFKGILIGVKIIIWGAPIWQGNPWGQLIKTTHNWKSSLSKVSGPKEKSLLWMSNGAAATYFTIWAALTCHIWTQLAFPLSSSVEMQLVLARNMEKGKFPSDGRMARLLSLTNRDILPNASHQPRTSRDNPVSEILENHNSDKFSWNLTSSLVLY